MKKLIFIFLTMTSLTVYAQDLKIKNNPYDKAPEETKNSKAFNRERWFFEQRMYPNNFIPNGVYTEANKQKEKIREESGFYNDAVNTWINIGPTSGFYFNYSNISSRVATVKYDPSDPNTIYIGAAYGGVWKTTNEGLNWTAKSDYENSLSSGALAIDPANVNNIYYMTGEATYSGASYYGGGLMKSTNAGTTWTNYTSGLPSAGKTNRIVVRPNNSTELLASMGTAGLYRSTNSGVSWTLIVSGRCDDVIFSPTGDTAYCIGSGTGYRVSVNGGVTFNTNATITPGTRNHIAVCKNFPNVLYAAIYSGSTITVFKSLNAGNTFSQIVVGQNFSGSQAWYDFYMHVSPFNPNYAYVGSIDIWRTTNGGATSFTNITNGYGGGNVHVDQHNLDFNPLDSNKMICSNDGGVWKSNDRGTSWTNLNSSLTLTQFYRIASDPSNPSHILGGTQDNGTQRTLGTLNWTGAFGGDGAEVCFHAQNNSYILGESQNNGVQRSTNGGTSWTGATSGLSGTAAWVAPLTSHPDSATIFYTARQQVFKTTTWGASWSAISSGTSGTIREMAISKSSPNVMYATSGSTIYKSTNRGYTFANVTTVGLPVRTITSVYVHPDSSNVAIITFSGFGAGKIYKTTNTGASWFDISGNLPDSPANDGLIYYPGFATSAYLIGMDNGVYVTTNYGSSWSELADGLPNTVAMHLDYNLSGNKLRIGTHGRGVYETTLRLSLPTTFNVKVIQQGFYNTVSNKLNQRDTVRIYFRDVTTPYSIVDSAKIVIDSNTFTGTNNFSNFLAGTYYIVVNHRNCIETWSKSGGQLINSGISYTYDFTTGNVQSYGSNMTQINASPLRFGIYSGDVNKDGIIDGVDLSNTENSAGVGLSGYVSTEVTGDNYVDASDVSILDNNSESGISIVRP